MAQVMGESCCSRDLLPVSSKPNALRKPARDLGHLDCVSQPVVDRDPCFRCRNLGDPGEPLESGRVKDAIVVALGLAPVLRLILLDEATVRLADACHDRRL